CWKDSRNSMNGTIVSTCPNGWAFRDFAEAGATSLSRERRSFSPSMKVTTLTSVSGLEYFQRLNNPSEWTRKMMPYFRNMSRSVCNLRYSDGPGEGGFIATLRFSASNKTEDELLEITLPEIGNAPGIVGVHFLVADGAASNIPTVEKTF